MNSLEVWKEVKGYEGLYEISSFGRVKTLPREIQTGKDLKFKKLVKEKIHIPCDNGAGYKMVSFRVGGGKNKNKYIHRMVAESFLENPSLLLEVNHKNGVKSDNRLENLEWCDRSFNMKHAFAKGLTFSHKGESNNQSKLTEDGVRFIRSEYAKGAFTQKTLSQMFGVCEQYISTIVMRRKWKHVA